MAFSQHLINVNLISVNERFISFCWELELIRNKFSGKSDLNGFQTFHQMV
jgi:hypothetical protein